MIATLPCSQDKVVWSVRDIFIKSVQDIIRISHMGLSQPYGSAKVNGQGKINLVLLLSRSMSEPLKTSIRQPTRMQC